MAALRAAAVEDLGGWRFRSGGWHTSEQARDIVEACLRLDVMVTDIITAAGWIALVRKVTALEEARP
jgi:hypothetical protein